MYGIWITAYSKKSAGWMTDRDGTHQHGGKKQKPLFWTTEAEAQEHLDWIHNHPIYYEYAKCCSVQKYLGNEYGSE